MNITLLDKDKLLHNFSRCKSWEEKYLYIIELGNYLPPLPDKVRIPEHLIPGCQSQVWIVMIADDNGDIKIYGDSNASIVKGLIATVFILYKGLTLAEVTELDVYPFFHRLALTQHLTSSRSQGLESIVRAIRLQAAAFLQVKAGQLKIAN